MVNENSCFSEISFASDLCGYAPAVKIIHFILILKVGLIISQFHLYTCFLVFRAAKLGKISGKL